MDRERVADIIQEAIETHEDGLLSIEDFLSIADRIIAEEAPHKCLEELDLDHSYKHDKPQQPKLPERLDYTKDEDFFDKLVKIHFTINEIRDYLKAKETDDTKG